MKSNSNERYSLAMITLLICASSLTAQSQMGTKVPPRSTAASIHGEMSTDQALAAAKGLSQAFRQVSERLLPSVVSIETSPKMARVDTRQGPSAVPEPAQNPFQGTPWEDLFRGGTLEAPAEGSRPAPRGMGSGVVIDPAGVILTNNHVVAGGGDIMVRLADGREFPAIGVWTDPQSDVAIVKIETGDRLVAARMGNSDAVEIGDWVLALGQPFGLESTVTAGIISAKHRGIGIADRENFLQTDAAINPGNSGGPLVNLDGEIVGINTAISSRSGGSDGIGFAIPVNQVRWVADQLARQGTVHRAYLGVGIRPITQDIAAELHLKPREGVVVTEVYPDTPAARTGLRPGDVIVEFAGSDITSPQVLQLVVEQAELGRQHRMKVIRNGMPTTLKFTAEELPSDFLSQR